PRLSLGTVYRNLRVLVEQGNLRELDFGMAVTYFETIKDSHYHLICRVCGRITDVEASIEPGLNTLVEKARGIGGFQIEKHRLDFFCLFASLPVETTETRRKDPLLDKRGKPGSS